MRGWGKHTEGGKKVFTYSTHNVACAADIPIHRGQKGRSAGGGVRRDLATAWLLRLLAGLVGAWGWHSGGAGQHRTGKNKKDSHIPNPTTVQPPHCAVRVLSTHVQAAGRTPVELRLRLLQLLAVCWLNGAGGASEEQWGAGQQKNHASVRGSHSLVRRGGFDARSDSTKMVRPVIRPYTAVYGRILTA